MEHLVRADGDFNLWADIVEGLDLLPADYVPEPIPKQYELNYQALIVLLRPADEPEVWEAFAICTDTQGLIDQTCDWYESRGFPVALKTPPLPPEEATRYLDALLLANGVKSGGGVYPGGNKYE